MEKVIEFYPRLGQDAEEEAAAEPGQVVVQVPRVPAPCQLTDKGGQCWGVVGKYTSNGSLPRKIQVKHYEGSWEVHVDIGAANRGPKAQAKAAISLPLDAARELVGALACAIEQAEAARRG